MQSNSWQTQRNPGEIVKASHPCLETSKMTIVILAQGAALPKERQQHSKASASADNDSCYHNHRQTTMTIKDNGHGDKDDQEKEDLTDIPNDNPSDHLRTKNSEFTPEFQMVAEPSRPATIPTTRSDDYHQHQSTSSRLSSTSPTPTSLGRSEEHLQEHRLHIDPHELPDHL